MLLTPKPVLSWKFASLLLITALLPALSAAQASPAAPPHRVVIRAGRVLDVKSGNTLTNQTIVIEGDKIVSIGASLRRQIGREHAGHRPSQRDGTSRLDRLAYSSDGRS